MSNAEYTEPTDRYSGCAVYGGLFVIGGGLILVLPQFWPYVICIITGFGFGVAFAGSELGRQLLSQGPANTTLFASGQRLLNLPAEVYRQQQARLRLYVTGHPFITVPVGIYQRYKTRLQSPVWIVTTTARIVGLGVGVALMCLGQLQIFRNPSEGILRDGYLEMLAGVVLSFVMSGGIDPLLSGISDHLANTGITTGVRRLRIRWGWLLLSLGLMLWETKLTVTKPQQTQMGVHLLLWMLSITAWVIAMLPRKNDVPVEVSNADGTIPTPVDDKALRRWEYVLLIGLFLAAFAIRGINLAHEPYLMDGDEALFAREGANYVFHDNFMITPFEPGIHSHPRIYMSMIAISTQLFGVNLFGARLPSVLMGALTIPALFLLARELSNWQTGLVAALFLLGWAFDIQFSRLAMNQPADPLFGTLAFYFLLRGLRRRSPVDFTISGIMVGVAQMFYLGGRLIPLVMIAYLFFIWLRQREAVRGRWKLILLIPVTALLVTLPQNAFLYANHLQISTRADTSILLNGQLNEAIQHDQFNTYMGGQIRGAFLGLWSLPDRSAWYGRSSNLAGPIGGSLILLGVLASLFVIWKHPKWSLPLGWSLAVILSGAVLTISPPQYERYFPAVTAMSLLAAMGVSVLAAGIANVIRQLNLRRRTMPGLGLRIALAIGVFVGVFNLVFYTGIYVPERRYMMLRTDWFDNRLSIEMMNEYALGHQVVMLGKYLSSVQNTEIVKYFMIDKQYVDGTKDALNDLLAKLDMSKPTTFFIPPERTDDLKKLSTLYRAATLVEISIEQTHNVAFYMVKVGS